MTPGIAPLSQLQAKKFDVAIVGAGINGASAAQHLAAAGYSVLIVDQGDYADGASSRSSRLLHCGLRHLASGSSVWNMLKRPARLMQQIKTVRADMVAREEIVRTIPTRVKPFNFCLPIYGDDAYRPWHVDAAFATLRMAGPSAVPLNYRRYDSQTLGNVPIAPWLRDPDQLKSVAVFREYIFDWPERIALDALFDARRMGAVTKNHTQVTGFERAEEEWRLSLQATGQGSDRAQVTASVVLNLAGAWVDEVTGITGHNTPQKCTGIKGIHIAVQLPPEFAEWGVFAYNSLDEPLYCLPWRGIHYVGLTRTPHQGDIAGTYATDAEIDWMISETNRVMPKLALTGADVLYSWAGVNPLTYDPAEPLGSRAIEIHDLGRDGIPGMLTLTGGAIMTHRRVANKLVDKLAGMIPPSHAPQKMRFAPGPDDVAHCAKGEQPTCLADLIMRRLGHGWDADQGVGVVRQVAKQAAPYLGWSDQQTDQEVAGYLAHLAHARRKPRQKS